MSQISKKKEPLTVFTLPALPYANDALEPYISRRTLEIHHGKHHAGYLRKLKELLDERGPKSGNLESLVRSSTGDIHQNAAQAWNHSLYWQSMRPSGGSEPPLDVTALLVGSFGDIATFKKAFTEAALGHFGSGWAWLIWRDGRADVETTHDAGCPIGDGIPLLVCDVWEHAYYLDRQNDRGAYIDAWWHVVNWDLIAERLPPRP